MIKKNVSILLLLAIALTSLHSYAQQNDELDVRQAIDKFYRVLSFSDTNSIKLDSLPELFTKEGKLVAAFGNDVAIWTSSEFVAYVRKSIPAQGVTARGEKEVSAKTEWFGHIAHVFSTYELTVQAKGQSLARRGINSIQLVKQGNEWKIISLTWDREGDALKLPPKYLQD